MLLLPQFADNVVKTLWQPGPMGALCQIQNGLSNSWSVLNSDGLSVSLFNCPKIQDGLSVAFQDGLRPVYAEQLGVEAAPADCRHR